MMLHPPNTFLRFWTIAELRAWAAELRARRLTSAWDGFNSVPTAKQTAAELRRRNSRAKATRGKSGMAGGV